MKPKRDAKRKRQKVVPSFRENWIRIDGVEGETEESVAEFAGQSGVLKRRSDGQPDVRLEGDHALVCFYKRESVGLAYTLLDEARMGKRVVRVAKTAAPEEPSLPSRREAALMGRTALAEVQRNAARVEDQMLAWDETQGRRHVLLRQAFTPDEAADDPDFYSDLRQDILDEAARLGRIEACHVFEAHPLGLVAIKFERSDAAEACIHAWNGRNFGGRPLVTEWFDPAKDYSVPTLSHDDSDAIERLASWVDNT